MQRISYIDSVKGFSILLIVLGHIIPNSGLKTWIYTFHVPIFLIISGILIAEKCKKSQKIEVKKQFFKLIYPYITFSFAVLIKDIIKNILENKAIINGIFINDFIKTLTLEGYGTLWFLPILFFAEVIASSILAKQNNFKVDNTYKLIILLIIIYILRPLNYFNYITKILIAAFFLIAGYLFRSIDLLFSKKLNAIILFLILIAFIPLSLINGKVDMHYSIYNNLLLYILISLINSMLVILFFKNFNYQFKLLKFFGENSLIVMITHSILPVITICSLHKKFFNKPIISDLITFAFCIAIEILIVFIIKKYFYFMFNFKKSLRKDK